MAIVELREFKAGVVVRESSELVAGAKEWHRYLWEEVLGRDSRFKKQKSLEVIPLWKSHDVGGVERRILAVTASSELSWGLPVVAAEVVDVMKEGEGLDVLLSWRWADDERLKGASFEYRVGFLPKHLWSIEERGNGVKFMVGRPGEMGMVEDTSGETGFYINQGLFVFGELVEAEEEWGSVWYGRG